MYGFQKSTLWLSTEISQDEPKRIVIAKPIKVYESKSAGNAESIAPLTARTHITTV